MASLQFIFVLVIVAVGVQAADQSECSVQVDVDYPDSGVPTASCSDTCSTDDSSSTWFEGTAYYRVAELTQQYGLMVKLNYQGGSLTGCTTVTFQTVEESAAELKALNECLGINELVITTTTTAATTPADTTPADTTPADTTPADTTPADTTPAATTPSATTSAPQSSCPEDFTQVLDYCYIISPNAVGKIDGLAYCASKGASLAFIASEEEQLAVQAILTTHVFIGINDIDEEDVFTSFEGEPATYTNWNDGEPNGGRTANCVVMRQNRDFKWNDINCSKEFNALCKRAPSA